MDGHVVAIVQARTGSTRLPNKMLAPLAGKPLIEWVLTRVARSSQIDTVILATSTLPRDDALAAYGDALDIPVFRGSENDVLGRFIGAIDYIAPRGGEPAAVVRVCADNPFVAPEEIDRLVRFFRDKSRGADDGTTRDAAVDAPYDYACNHQERLGNGYPDGFGAEIVSTAVLRRVAAIAKEPQYREHVTLYLWDHADQFRIAAVPAPEEIAYPDLVFDVDERADLERLERFVAGYRIDADTSVRHIVEAAIDYRR